MATLRAYYPAGYAAMVTICKENKYDPEEEIPAFIETTQIKEAQIIKAAVRKESPADTPGAGYIVTGLEGMKNYAKGYQHDKHKRS